MADQLSLFPSQDLPPGEPPLRQTDISALDEMFSAGRRYRASRTYKEMLKFISRFPQYSAFNGFLLYIQNPDATCVFTAGVWERRFSRKPKKEATPLAILAPMAPVLFLYDIKDTEGGSVEADLLKQMEVPERQLREIFEKTLENCNVHGITVRFGQSSDPRVGQAVTLTYNTRQQFRDLNPDSSASYLIVLEHMADLRVRYQQLVHGLGHIFCGHLGIDAKAWWQDRRNVERSRADIEAQSAAFLVLRRKGLIRLSEAYLSGYRQNDRELPVFGLNAIFHSTQYIEDMGKSFWEFPKRKSRYL